MEAQELSNTMTEHKPEGNPEGPQANSIPGSADVPSKDGGDIKRQASTGSPVFQKQTAGYLAFTAVVIYLGWGADQHRRQPHTDIVNTYHPVPQPEHHTV